MQQLSSNYNHCNVLSHIVFPTNKQWQEWKITKTFQLVLVSFNRIREEMYNKIEKIF